MAKKKKQQKKKGKNHTKAAVFSQTMVITLMFMIISNIAEKDREEAFLIGTILLMLAGIPSTRLLNN